MGTSDLGTEVVVPCVHAVTLPSQSCTRRSFLSGGLLFCGSTLLRTPLRQAIAADAPPKASPSNLDFASALEVARAIRRGEVSCVELTTHLLERIERFNPQLNAIVTLTPDAALARARAADEARARGEWWGPLHGVPCTIKDTFETAGVRTTAGAPFLSAHRATQGRRQCGGGLAPRRGPRQAV